jgi:hypothetical protein
MVELGARGSGAAARRLEQGSVVGLRLCAVAGCFRGPTGVVKSVEAVRTQFKGLLVFGQRLLGLAQFQQDIREHFPRRNIHLALADRVLQIRAVTHVFQRIDRLGAAQEEPLRISSQAITRPGTAACGSQLHHHMPRYGVVLEGIHR